MEVKLEKCINKYQQFIDTISEDVEDDFVRLGNLIKCDKLSEFDQEIKFEHALHDLTDKCYRITNKKSQYYTHIYNPDFVIDLIKDLENQDDILEALDLTPRDNCCNCVSFVCYSTGKINYLFDYLYSMKKSLDNITRCLEGFIARYYLDPSIFEVIYQNFISTDIATKNFAIDCYRLLKYILASPRAETYIYFCKMIIEGLSIDKIRTLRFLPMFETDVNISVIREADGFVSYLDCHNINLFQRVNKILMIYEFGPTFFTSSFNHNSNENYTWHYSEWLKTFSLIKYLYIKHSENEPIYSKYIEDNYNKDFVIRSDIIKNYYPSSTNFMNNKKLFDVLAGTIALKVKFSNEYLIKKINFINGIINFSIKEYQTELDKVPARSINLIFNGYDEILLCELFEPLITLNKKILGLEKYKDETEEFIIEKINEIKSNILNMFILIENNDKSIYNFENNRTSINHDFKKNITGVKIRLDGQKSSYTFEEICKSSYIEEIGFYDINNLYKTRGWILTRIQNKFYGYFIDYIVDLAYTLEYLKDEYKDYFYNIGINLLNKKFFNIDEGVYTSDNEDLKDFIESYKQLNTFYNKIYPPSYFEPMVNYKLKYLKYKEKYLKLKNNK